MMESSTPVVSGSKHMEWHVLGVEFFQRASDPVGTIQIAERPPALIEWPAEQVLWERYARMRILKYDGSQGSLILVCIRQTIKLLVQHSHALARPQSLAGALAVHQLPPHLEVPVAECVIAKNYQSTDPPVAGTRQHWIREMLNASRKFVSTRKPQNWRRAVNDRAIRTILPESRAEGGASNHRGVEVVKCRPAAEDDATRLIARSLELWSRPANFLLD